MWAATAAKPMGPRARADMALYGIYEISKLLSEPGRLEVTFARTMEVLASFLDMRHGLIALLGEDGSPEVVVGSGWSEETAKHYFEKLPERAIGRIVVTQMPFVVENVREEPLFEAWDFSGESTEETTIAFIGVPIKDRGRVVGTLTIDRVRGGDPSSSLDEDVRFLSMVGNLMGQTVRLHRLVSRDRERLMESHHRLEKAIESTVIIDHAPELPGIVGDSRSIRSVMEKIRIVARSHSTVLLRGESGTGKELFARAIHDLSPRRNRVFVAVNCAALPEAILESELFGHEKGSFTGATALRKGRFELADGGTLFLDEIGEISAPFQAKLLRVLQEGEFERVGGTTTQRVSVRLVAATNKNLEEAVTRGEFRSDLYYRISVVPVFLPPLRERPEDIPLLAREFLRRFNGEHGTTLAFAGESVPVLTSCMFPGNVRELENCVRRTATLAQGKAILPSDFACRHDECLSSMIRKQQASALPHAPQAPPQLPTPGGGVEDPDGEDVEGPPSSGSMVRGNGRLDRERLLRAMESAGWVQAKAARILGVTSRQVGYALRKHDIAIKRL